MGSRLRLDAGDGRIPPGELLTLWLTTSNASDCLANVAIGAHSVIITWAVQGVDDRGLATSAPSQEES